MEAFVDGNHVWLRNIGRDLYLHVDADGLGVSVHSRRAVLQAAWIVHLSGDHILLHSAVYGRYLGAGLVQYIFGPRAMRRAAILAVPRRSWTSWSGVSSPIAWESIAADEGSTDDAVILRNITGGYLRANGRIRRWNTAVSVSDAPAPGELSNMSFWVAETIPPLPARMDIPLPVEAPHPLHPISQVGPLRQVFYVRAAADGSVDEDAWEMFEVAMSHSLDNLTLELRNRLGLDVYFTLMLCIRSGRYGRLVPLVVDLSRNNYPLHIVLLTHGSPAALRYPNVHA
ncbi:uncharacterized protein [Triticum aestivum]|uniref:uncharacterized protein n=1 Tax=Triticum aestivum TaxID=4565 RepID=UPI001D02D105|nr:uncharacterized protein LOC123101579 [Triticum aestivum]